MAPFSIRLVTKLELVAFGCHREFKFRRMLRFLVFVIAAVVSVLGNPKTDPFLYDKFPGDFVWGTATASYQIAGAWNTSGMFFFVLQ